MSSVDSIASIPLDTATLSKFCNDVAEGAREIALTYFRSPVAYERKSDLSPVTIADRAIEDFVRDRILERFPDHGVVGEEGEDRPGKRFVWYVDRIDGTKSFISGMPLFGTSFIGYARSPHRIEKMIENMFVGNPPGTYDYLLDFSRAVTGCLFFVPTVDFLDNVTPEPPQPAAVAQGDFQPTNDDPARSPPRDGSLGIGYLKEAGHE